MFYTYLWLREDGTPYYIGKGHGDRAYKRHKRQGKAPTKGRIVFYIAKDEADAFENETALIWYYGRKDLGTGCLRNLTDGGEGPAGRHWSLETRGKSVKSLTGRKLTEEHCENIRKSMIGNKRATGTKQAPESIAKRVVFLKMPRGPWAASRSRVFSKEWRKNISESAKRREAAKRLSKKKEQV